jgi:hypothetical protein
VSAWIDRSTDPILVLAAEQEEGDEVHGEHGLFDRLGAASAEAAGSGAAPPAGLPVPPDGRGAGRPLPQEKDGLHASPRHHHRRDRPIQVRPLGAPWYVHTRPAGANFCPIHHKIRTKRAHEIFLSVLSILRIMIL